VKSAFKIGQECVLFREKNDTVP